MNGWASTFASRRKLVACSISFVPNLYRCPSLVRSTYPRSLIVNNNRKARLLFKDARLAISFSVSPSESPKASKTSSALSTASTTYLCALCFGNFIPVPHFGIQNKIALFDAEQHVFSPVLVCQV